MADYAKLHVIREARLFNHYGIKNDAVVVKIFPGVFH